MHELDVCCVVLEVETKRQSGVLWEGSRSPGKQPKGCFSTRIELKRARVYLLRYHRTDPSAGLEQPERVAYRVVARYFSLRYSRGLAREWWSVVL